jgi:hypothetical protein
MILLSSAGGQPDSRRHDGGGHGGVISKPARRQPVSPLVSPLPFRENHIEHSLLSRGGLPVKSRVAWGLPGVIAAAVLFALTSSFLRASDHADPMALREPESNITGLFFFPKGDQMILILNIRRALIDPKPYNLAPFEYAVHMDLTSPLSFEDPADRGHYGGTIVVPERLHPDASIRVKLNDDTTLKNVSFTGLKDTDRIRVFSGVRDDPFIFPRFFRRNVISMVFGIPMSAFPQGQRDFILWGTTYKDGRQIDHVGRSNRTQQARFDALNTLPPHEHVKKIMELARKWDGVYRFFNGFDEWWSKSIAGLLQYLIQIRKYDMQPDVMIYTDRFPPGFPNGRQLPDDVAALTCQAGDCILQELSFVEGGWPRQTVNDKPFSDDWPYLAEPWPDQATSPMAKSIWPYAIGLLLVLLIVSWGVVEIVRRLILWLWHHLRREAVAGA